MSFITRDKANVKYLLIVFLLALFIGAGFLFYQYWWLPKWESGSPEVNWRPAVEIENEIESQNIIFLELESLGIEIVGQSRQIELELPSVLSDANWGLKKEVCEQGGYDLAAHAGKTLLFTTYPINEMYGTMELLDVWVVTSENEVVCVFKAVRPESNSAPGIFSIKDPNIKKVE